MLLLNSEQAASKQYVARALGHEVVDGDASAIEFIVEPNLGETIADFDEVNYVSKLAFQWKAEELASLTTPQFGLAINGGEEHIYAINKETGLAELTMNVEAGNYTLSVRLYDGNLLVGENDKDTTVNFVEGESAQTDIIPLQGDVSFEIAEIKDRGTFTFNLPTALVEEVGGAENLTVIARLSGTDTPLQEEVLSVSDVNGAFVASTMFETGGAETVNVYLAFYQPILRQIWKASIRFQAAQPPSMWRQTKPWVAKLS